jgi:hypothetical protein
MKFPFVTKCTKSYSPIRTKFRDLEITASGIIFFTKESLYFCNQYKNTNLVSPF